MLLSEPSYNTDIAAYEPCDTCMEVILDTLAGYRDRPSVQEDELGQSHTDEQAAQDRRDATYVAAAWELFPD